MHAGVVCALALACALALHGGAFAAPRVPVDDSELIETLPSIAASARDERAWRRALARQPGDQDLALRAARELLAKAREQGDARYAGQALGALRPWEPVSGRTPAPVLVMHADISQFLHDFAGAEASLRLALAQAPRDAQGWLMLATVQRVRGKLGEADASCRGVSRAGQDVHAIACLAENAALRGDTDGARRALDELLGRPALRSPAQAGTRLWLWTTMAEVEELAGRPAQAERAYRRAIAERRDGYALIAYADLLLSQSRHREVPALLADQPRSDAVLLRLAVALQAAPAPNPAADELRARFDASAERPGGSGAHAREEAMFALDVLGDARRALRLARDNAARQREPVDLLLYARAAAAARDDDARRELAVLMQTLGVRDARVDRLP
ncbi:hypothetical protein [Variovorax sp. JS1663]|uniref:hypothetical protein n=1 Tax=Variovorax sp. JS1663 TaxID=1851577 RepID=UPI000B34192F|nr:hypothetical protein [Variovorax sp. JS1663]OUM02988.1 hypothetical protein A8M77_08585 [Variovorax sp. JS1663]